MSERITMLTLTRIEAVHLADLVDQFGELLEASAEDPALDRLTPDAYPEDPDASRDFRRMTRSDLLDRRADDAALVLRDLERIDETGSSRDTEPVDIAIDGDGLNAWMRTLAALRLVIAERLGIATEADHDPDDPRFGVYDWLGYRLEGLIQASDLG